MAQETVKNKNVSVTLSCKIFMISETCYRYTARLSDENSLIAQYLIDLTNQKKNWGFKLCFLYLRNVKGYKFNHKRVYRIYTELALNLRIKPRRRLKRDKPAVLHSPSNINQVWSMDFMHARLYKGNSVRLFAALSC